MKRRLVLALLFAGLLASCSRDGPPPERGPATPIDAATAGAIQGVVAFVGTPPPSTSLSIQGDPACSAAHPGAADAGDVLVHEGKLENAFVYVEKGLEGRVFERPVQAALLDQQGCLFAPRIAGVQTGQPIEFVNSDATLHNVHTQPQASHGVNFGLAQRGARRAIHINAPEVMVTVRCDVHPWMRAFVGVLEHPHFAVTKADGAFRFEPLPAGRYTVSSWHERLGKKSETVTVAAGEPAATDLRYEK